VPALRTTLSAINDTYLKVQHEILETFVDRGQLQRLAQHTSWSGFTLLDVGGRYPDNPFAAVILPDDAGKFPEVGSLSGKMVEVTGSVRLYNRKPEVILRRPDQIKAE